MDSRRLLVTDLDGTLLGDEEALERFAAWHAANRGEIVLAYATGRTRDGIRSLVDTSPAPAPDILITQVGTEVHDATGAPWPGWRERFRDWHADDVRRTLAPIPELHLQPAEYQTDLKASYFATELRPDAISQIRRRLSGAGLRGRIVYSARQFLDILPPGSGKGAAALLVAQTLGLGPDRVLVFGDTGNDIDLFRHGFRGTVVGNALRELTNAAGAAYRSDLPHADGVLDGIRHWWVATSDQGGVAVAG